MTALFPLFRRVEIKNKHFQYKFEFNLIEYTTELESFEKHYKE